jgi:hypothetical protein
MDVRTRNCRISAGWRLSTSSARKSVMNRLSPPNWLAKALGGVAAQPGRREVQPGRPLLGPLDQHGNIGEAELSR